jgi:hypothetical protein
LQKITPDYLMAIKVLPFLSELIIENQFNFVKKIQNTKNEQNREKQSI